MKKTGKELLKELSDVFMDDHLDNATPEERHQALDNFLEEYEKWMKRPPLDIPDDEWEEYIESTKRY